MLCRCKVTTLTPYGSFVWRQCISHECHITCLFPPNLFFYIKSVVYHGWHFEDVDIYWMFILIVEYDLAHRHDSLWTVRHVISVLIRLYGRVLGAQRFPSAVATRSSTASNSKHWVTTSVLGGRCRKSDARSVAQRLCLCSLTELTGAARSAA